MKTPTEIKSEKLKTNTTLARIPFMGKVLKQFEDNVKDKGFQQAAEEFVAVGGKGKFKIDGKDEKLQKILATKPVVVISNHPSDAEVMLVVASLEPRDDIYLIAISSFLEIGPNTAKHILPIYISKQMISKSYKFSVWFATKLKIGKLLSSDEAHSRNKESIQNAINKVKKGGVVIMFPEGIQTKPKKWLNGIGYLVSGVGQEFDAYIIYTYTRGTSNLDFLRLVPFIRKLLPQATLTFAKPRKISELITADYGPKEITKNLEEDYNKWQGI